MNTKTNLFSSRFLWAITALLIASLACGAPGSTRALISELALDEAMGALKETELEYIEQNIGEHTYDVAPPIVAANNLQCLPEISVSAHSTLNTTYIPGEERDEHEITINDGSVTRTYTQLTFENMFCKTTKSELYECIQFQPGGFDLLVFSAPSNPDEFHINPKNLCYTMNYRRLPAAADIPDDPEQQEQNETHDACDLSAYLGLQIEVTENFVNQFNTHICHYSAHFKNNHPTSAGIPIIKVHQLDCFQDLDIHSYWALESIPPGGQVTWIVGNSSDHDDNDCPSRISGWFLVLAGMIVDDEQCVLDILRNRAYEQGYTDQIGLPVSAPGFGCPMP